MHGKESTCELCNLNINIDLNSENAYDFLKRRLTEIGYDGSKLINTDFQ